MDQKRNRLWEIPEGRDILFAVVIIVLMAVIFVYGCTFNMTSASGNVDSGFFPRLGSIVGFAAGALLLADSLRKYRRLQANGASPRPGEKEGGYNWPLMIISVIWLAAYLLLMQFLGMPLASILYLLLQTMLLTPREKRTKKTLIINVLVSVLMPLVVYFPFRYIFRVMLPMGIFR